MPEKGTPEYRAKWRYCPPCKIKFVTKEDCCPQCGNPDDELYVAQELKDAVLNIEVKYCSHCGVQCTADLVGAEKNMISYGFYGDDMTIPLAPPFDRKTGKRNYCLKYTCPNKEKKWYQLWSPHDDYFIDKVINL